MSRTILSLRFLARNISHKKRYMTLERQPLGYVGGISLLPLLLFRGVFLLVLVRDC
jgi:hypothetical protein